METKEMVFRDAREMDKIRHYISKDPVKIRVLRPLRSQDSTYISYLKSREIKVEEIHLPPEGDIISSEDGKLVMEKQKDGSMILTFSAEQEKAVIPEGVKVIDHKAFADSTIQEVVMPDTVETVCLSAFLSCKNLKRVRFSQNLRKIGTSAFFGCESLTEADLPDSLEVIKDQVFDKCSNFTVRRFPKNLREVGDYAFKGCSFADEIALPIFLKHIGKHNLTRAKFVRLNEVNTRRSENIISSMQNFYTIDCICFKIEGRNIVLPKSMTRESTEEACQILCKYKDLPAGTYTYYMLASSERSALSTALFGYSISPDPQVKEYLKEALQKRGSEFMHNAAEESEETLIQLLTLLGNDLLTDTLRLDALDTAEDHDMVSASTLCLQMNTPQRLDTFCL